jgi:stage III sporulation protein AG
MDWKSLKGNAAEVLTKYKYVCLVLLAGIFLMLLPTEKAQVDTSPQQTEVYIEESLAEKLADILSKTEGVGKVEVLLTEAGGMETVYQTDTDTSADGSVRTETVIVSSENRVQTGLVRTVTPPVYLGAIVVCQGAGSPTVRLEIVQAVSRLTGIPSDRITVLKMK